MVASYGSDGFGATLAKGATTIVRVFRISGPSISRKAIEITTNDSPNDYAQFVGGYADGGEVRIQGNWVNDSTQRAVITDLTGASASYTLTWPSMGSVSFTAIATALNPESPHDNRMTFDATFKITGKPTFTGAPSTSGSGSGTGS